MVNCHLRGMAEATERRFFTDSQRRVIGFALTLLAVLATAALFVLGTVALGRLAGYFSGVIWPLACAGVLALMLRPVVEIFEQRLKNRRLAAVILLYGLFVIVVAGVLVLLVPPLVEQLLNFISFAPTLWQSATGYVEQNYPDWIALVQRQMENPAIKRSSRPYPKKRTTCSPMRSLHSRPPAAVLLASSASRRMSRLCRSTYSFFCFRAVSLPATWMRTLLFSVSHCGKT